MKEVHFEIREYIREEMKTQRNQIEKELEEVYRNPKFISGLKLDLIAVIESEVDTKLKNKDLKKVVGEVIEIKLEELEFNLLLEKIIRKILNRMNNLFKEEYKVAKKLCLSIDTEIKHTLRDLPISYSTEEIIKKKIDCFFEDIKGTLIKDENKLLIENKKNKIIGNVQGFENEV